MSEVPWIEAPTWNIATDDVRSGRLQPPPSELATRFEELMVALEREDVGPLKMSLADAINLRTKGRFRAESGAFASTLGTTWRRILLAGCAYDLAMKFMACSTMALGTPDGPVLARNMDFWPERELAIHSCTLRHSDTQGWKSDILGWPGSIGVVTGMSRNGFAIALNAVMSDERPPVDGYPVMLFLRKLIDDAMDFDEAVERACRQRLRMDCLITKVGSENDQKAVVDRTPKKHSVRRPRGDDPLVVTNGYRSLECQSLYRSEIEMTACGRYDRLIKLLRQSPNDVGLQDEALLYFLTDPGVLARITAQHTIMRPRQRTTRLYFPRRFLSQPPQFG